MSYTAPQYVDTKEQAILALASTIKGEAVTGGDGSVNRALDVLADVLAEQDVQVPQTDAGAILALAQYVSGGGGSSDFTTAHVTFIASSDSHIVREDIHICTFLEEGENAASSPLPIATSSGTMAPPSGSTLEVDAILYKGNAVLLLPQDVTTTSGAIASLGDGMYMISGDCSLTV